MAMECSAVEPSDIMPRISGRLGNPLDLNLTFYRNGIPTDPYAIRKISIYRSAVQAENLVTEFLISSPLDPSYPTPISREVDSNNVVQPGVFHLYWEVPDTGIPTPDIFFDVWSYLPVNPGIGSGGTGATGTGSEDLLNDESLWQTCCEKFWLYPDGFYCDANLSNIRLAFEAMDAKLKQPEVRTIEVGIMPLPLYDFDYNKIAPLIPMLRAKISIWTENCELLVDGDPMEIGLRDGSYRSNPFTLKYRVCSSFFLKGSYKYRVMVCLPNGETRVSDDFHFMVV